MTGNYAFHFFKIVNTVDEVADGFVPKSAVTLSKITPVGHVLLCDKPI
mgnify:CR=1 FL=1